MLKSLLDCLILLLRGFFILRKLNFIHYNLINLYATFIFDINKFRPEPIYEDRAQVEHKQ